MAKLSIKDLALNGQRVFIRVDFNVPLKNGVIGDDTRIRASLPTIQYALERGATVVLASHLGRPKGTPNPEFSLRPIADRLSQLLGQPVTFAEDCIGDAAANAVRTAQDGSHLVLLENLRFHPEEETNDAGFARALASLADLYIDDAFGAAHRAHASVEGITHVLPKAAAGLLMEKELRYLGHALESPERPFVAILGGAKVSDKLEVIENMLGKVDRLIIGGAMAYTFFKARGIPVGKSLVEDDKLDAARKIEADAAAKGVTLALPVDHVVADKLDASAATEVLKVGDAAIGDRLGLDIGPETIRNYEACWPTRRPSCGTGRWASSRSTRSRPAPTPWRRRWRRSRARRSSAAAIRLPRSRRPASPTASRTSPPAAARRSSFSVAARSRAWRH